MERLLQALDELDDLLEVLGYLCQRHAWRIATVCAARRFERASEQAPAEGAFGPLTD